MAAASTHLPVIGIPVALKYLDGTDSLMSIVQMPRGVPVATVAINNSVNAALLAVRMLAMSDDVLAGRLVEYNRLQSEEVMRKVGVLETVGWEDY
jgi:phosphoribosylaminoimidazole carboxylase